MTYKVEIAGDTTEGGEDTDHISVFYGDEKAYWITQFRNSDDASPLRIDMVGMSRNQAAQVRDALSVLLGELSVSDYRQVLENNNRLVRELDVLLNGVDGAARQASLCDVVSQIKNDKLSLWSNGKDA